jgi:hypothetical protein
MVLSKVVESNPELDDELFSSFCDIFLTFNLGHLESVSFFSSIFLYYINKLEQPPSRELLGSLVACGKQYPKALKDAFLIPLFTSGLGTHFANTLLTSGSHHTELINSLLAECLLSEIQAAFFLYVLLGVFVTDRELVNGPLLLWTEFTVVAVQNIVNKQAFVMSQGMMDGLVRQLEGTVQGFTKNLKFCTLLFNLISKFRGLVSPHVFTLQKVLQQTETFMTKKALNKLPT